MSISIYQSIYLSVTYSALYPIPWILDLDSTGSSPTEFDQVYNDASIVVDDSGLTGAARGQKVARSRGVKGAKKLLAVAAAQGVSRSLEPRIGNKRSVQAEFFYAAGRRQSYDDARDLHALDMHRDRDVHRDVPQSTGSRASTSTSLSSSSSSSSNISMGSSRNNYPGIERQSLSSAEIKLERMQKAASEKAEKVRKVVEEKAAKIRKLAEEKANKLRCLAEEKVKDLTWLLLTYKYTSFRHSNSSSLSCCLLATTQTHHRRESYICKLTNLPG